MEVDGVREARSVAAAMAAAFAELLMPAAGTEAANCCARRNPLSPIGWVISRLRRPAEWPSPRLLGGQAGDPPG
jgi:hypothetical protein